MMQLSEDSEVLLSILCGVLHTLNAAAMRVAETATPEPRAEWCRRTLDT